LRACHTVIRGWCDVLLSDWISWLGIGITGSGQLPANRRVIAHSELDGGASTNNRPRNALDLRQVVFGYPIEYETVWCQ